MSHIRVDPPNTNNKWDEFGLANVDTFIICIGFELANVDTFIIRVGFGLVNVDTIRTLTRHEHDSLTRITTPKFFNKKWINMQMYTSVILQGESSESATKN